MFVQIPSSRNCACHFFQILSGTKMFGNTNCTFPKKITPVVVWLVVAGVWHFVRACHIGIYLKFDDFTGSDCSIISHALKVPTKVLTKIRMTLQTFTSTLNTWRSRRVNN